LLAMPHPELAPVSFVCMVLVMVPLPWHFRAGNVATVSTMLWLAFDNLHNFINAVIWRGNVVVEAKVYCDITLALFVASTIALPAAAVCITRHLENVSSPKYLPSDRATKRNRFIFEIIMCLVLPLVYSGFHLIVQGHRFDIIEDIGCITNTYMSWPAVFLTYGPLLVLSLITSVYAGMSLRWFIQRRAQFRDLFPSSSSLTTSRYFRLMALALTEILGTTIISLYAIINAALNQGIQPWVSWQYVHSNFGHINQFPEVLLSPQVMSVELGLWSFVPISSALFFVFFGFGEEACSEYRKYWAWIRRVILRRDPSQSTRKGSLPTFVEKSLSSRGTDEKWNKDDDSLFGDRLDVEAAKDVTISSSSNSSFDSRSMPSRPHTHPLHDSLEPNPIPVSITISRSMDVSGSPSFVESEK